ncbi:MAG: hypothetical protein ABH811_02395 [archaeon]
MKNQELINYFKEKFNNLKQELGFSSNLEEIDKIFFIKDYILREGFVSENLSRQLRSRMTELYVAWSNYLHSLIMPNPQNILNLSESRIFDSEEKKEITELMKKVMVVTSKNSLMSLTKENEKEAEFIDYCVNFWNNEFKKDLIKIMTKINQEWKRQ